MNPTKAKRFNERNVEANKRTRQARHARLHPKDRQTVEQAKKANSKGQMILQRAEWQAQDRMKRNEMPEKDASEWMKKHLQPVV